MLTYYPFQIKNSGTNTAVTGLTFGYTGPAPYITLLSKIPASAITASAGNITISEQGYGWYAVAFDADLQTADCYVLLDCGTSVTNADRYLLVSLPRTQSRILQGLPNGGALQVGSYASGVSPVTLLSSSGVPILTDGLGRITVGTNMDKTAYALAATGLDSVGTTDVVSVTDAKSTLPKQIRSLWDRQFDTVLQTSATQTVANDTGTVFATMTISDNGVTAVKGPAS